MTVKSLLGRKLLAVIVQTIINEQLRGIPFLLGTVVKCIDRMVMADSGRNIDIVRQFRRVDISLLLHHHCVDDPLRRLIAEYCRGIGHRR